MSVSDSVEAIKIFNVYKFHTLALPHPIITFDDNDDKDVFMVEHNVNN